MSCPILQYIYIWNIFSNDKSERFFSVSDQFSVVMNITCWLSTYPDKFFELLSKSRWYAGFPVRRTPHLEAQSGAIRNWNSCTTEYYLSNYMCPISIFFIFWISIVKIILIIQSAIAYKTYCMVRKLLIHSRYFTKVSMVLTLANPRSNACCFLKFRDRRWQWLFFAPYHSKGNWARLGRCASQVVVYWNFGAFRLKTSGWCAHIRWRCK